MAEPLDVELAEKIVGRIAVRAISRFGAFPEYDKDDLISEGLKRVLECWPRYDKSKAAASTFIYRVAWCHIQTLHRNRTRLGRRETGFVKDRDATAEEPSQDLSHSTLREWMEETYRGVCERMRDRVMISDENPKSITDAQAISIIALKLKKNLSVRGTRLLLESNPDLLATIGMSKPPSKSEIHRLSQSVPNMRLNFADGEKVSQA